MFGIVQNGPWILQVILLCIVSFSYAKKLPFQLIDPVKDALIEHVQFKSKENEDSDQQIERKGILVRYSTAKATVIICHGFMTDKYDVGFLRFLLPHGMFNYLTFDFRAHGECRDGQLCTFGRDEAHDVVAAGEFVRSHPLLKDMPLFVYGFSMGAVASIEAAAKKPNLFNAMVLDCPYDSTESIIKRSIGRLKVSLFGYEFDLPGRTYLEEYAYHPYIQSFIKLMLKTVARIDTTQIKVRIFPIKAAESIKKIEIPCLFMHCKNDEKVSVESVRTIFNNKPGYKKICLTEGRRHFDSFFYNPEKYISRVRKFYSAVLNGTIHQKQSGKIVHETNDGKHIEKTVQSLIAHKNNVRGYRA